jgi:hypothetical protein
MTTVNLLFPYNSVGAHGLAEKLNFFGNVSSIGSNYSLFQKVLFLDYRFPGQWVGRDGTVSWPPHSPDLMSLGVFMENYKPISVPTNLLRKAN